MRLIDADTLLEKVEEYINEEIEYGENKKDLENQYIVKGLRIALKDIKYAIKKQPTIEPIKYEHWKQIKPKKE